MNFNMFSMFDPSTSSFLSLNWISLSLFLFFLPFHFWIFYSRWFFCIKMMSNFLFNEMTISFQNFNINKIYFFLNLFFFILFLNMLGMFPFIFTPTSHICISFSFSLPLWLSLFIFFWFSFPLNMFSHLLPKNTPLFLASFMVIIETISSLIRPLTLAVRLTANMIAGHLLLCLLSQLNEKSLFLFFILLPILLILIILEFSVALIQSYVFSTLFSLYINEM